MTLTMEPAIESTASISESEPQPSAPKQPKADRAKGKRSPEYKEEWKREFHWLEPVRNESGQVVGLNCKLCRWHKRKNRFNQSTVRSKTPCTTVQKDTVRRHSLSQQHKAAVEMETCREAATRTRGIQQALQSQLQLRKEAVRTAISIAYPNCSKLAQIGLLFSTMHRVKSRLRSEMNNSTLHHCMRISIEGPCMEEFNFNTSLEMWSSLKNRRIC